VMSIVCWVAIAGPIVLAWFGSALYGG